MTANYECSRGNRENFPLPNQIKLSAKPSIFGDISLPFLESTLNFQCFEKKEEASLLQYFWSDGMIKARFFNCIAGLFSGSSLAVNLLTSLKDPEIRRKVPLSYFSIILSQIELEKVFFYQIWGFRTSWKHVDCQLRVFSQQ